MNFKEVLVGSSSLLSGKLRWILVLLLLVIGGCKPWLHIDRIDLDSFESIRSSVSPDIETLFDESKQEFERSGYCYRYRHATDMESTYEKYGVLDLHICQFGKNSELPYEVLFAFTSQVRGSGGGYYYTPSGKLPPWAPMYGVVCSKHIDDYWYAFNTVDSSDLPSPENCPEDTQYQ